MNDPPLPARRGFAGEVHAREHLCDHGLTRPEAHDWALLLPDLRNSVDPTDDPVLRRTAASLFSGPPRPEALRLRDQYVQALEIAIGDALRLGMWWRQDHGKYKEWCGLGLDGIFVIWDAEVIKSGYFLISAAFPPDGPCLPRTENPLPRRNPQQRLRPPPPDTPRRRYDLFAGNLLRASDMYEDAHCRKLIQAAGGLAFVTRPLRITRWQQCIAERPSRDARFAR